MARVDLTRRSRQTWHARSVSVGAAAEPRSQDRWRPNPRGARRSLDEALDVGRRNDVDVDDERFLWAIGDAGGFAAGELATYAQVRHFRDEMIVHRSRLVTRGGRYRVLLNPSILASDDTILAVLVHEVHEIQGLDDAFGSQGTLSGKEFRSLVDTRTGRLHCAAWDEADRRVLSLIEANKWP